MAFMNGPAVVLTVVKGPRGNNFPISFNYVDLRTDYSSTFPR